MKPYKSIFKESGGSLELAFEREVATEGQAKQIVDISNLVWSKDFGEKTWKEAIYLCPTGYRLPTVQELYTAYVKRIPDFGNDTYWSFNTYTKNTNYAWLVPFGNGLVFYSYKTYSFYVRYVKDL